MEKVRNNEWFNRQWRYKTPRQNGAGCFYATSMCVNFFSICSIKCFTEFGNRYNGLGVYNFGSARIERALPPSEGGILSVEIRGRVVTCLFYCK